MKNRLGISAAFSNGTTLSRKQPSKVRLSDRLFRSPQQQSAKGGNPVWIASPASFARRWNLQGLFHPIRFFMNECFVMPCRRWWTGI